MSATARQKIEGLTHSWYGWTAFTSLLALWDRGIGIISLFLTGVGFLLSCLVIWFLGNRLVNKSSLTRVLLVVLSAIVSVLGTIGTAKLGWTFINTFSLSVALQAAFTGLGVYMHAPAPATDRGSALAGQGLRRRGAASIAHSTARALVRVSSASAWGSLASTIPAPAVTSNVSPLSTIVRMAIAKSRSDVVAM